jgi:hypothetical protein
MTPEQETLIKVHTLRMKAHWGKNAAIGQWPQSDADWRQTPHGAPWDTNVEMAKFYLKLAQSIKDEGLLT